MKETFINSELLHDQDNVCITSLFLKKTYLYILSNNPHSTILITLKFTVKLDFESFLNKLYISAV